MPICTQISRLNLKTSIFDYRKQSVIDAKVNWWDLPSSVKLQMKILPSDIKQLGNFTSVGKLRKTKDRDLVTNNIIGIKKAMMGSERICFSFPLSLDNINYVRLYSLMISEGSHTTEFSLTVPEVEFHQLFKECIKKLISENAANEIRQDNNHHFLRYRAPALIRHLIPIPNLIPSLIIDNKEYSREYLRIAFEAEGSAIFDGKHKRYLKLSRYSDITSFVKTENLPTGVRLYKGTIKQKYPVLWKIIEQFPPETLLGESLLLKHHFNIENKLVLEAIKNNKTSFRAGKITARWVLLIYANNINKFIEEINFISPLKRKKCEEMLKVHAQNQQYSVLKLMQTISKNNRFQRKHFIKEMRNGGYKSPGCFIHKYINGRYIKRIGRGEYEIILIPT